MTTRSDINAQKNWVDMNWVEKFELVVVNDNLQLYKMGRKAFATRKSWRPTTRWKKRQQQATRWGTSRPWWSTITMITKKANKATTITNKKEDHGDGNKRKAMMKASKKAMTITGTNKNPQWSTITNKATTMTTTKRITTTKIKGT